MKNGFDIKRDMLKRVFSYEGFDLLYRIYLPQDLSSGKRYPLLLFLHGAGERGSDNESQLKHMLWQFFEKEDSPIYRSIVIAPQCPKEARWAEKVKPGEDRDSICTQVMRSTIALVKETIKEQPVDTEHVYVMGLSMGGGGTWYLLTHESDLFAGGVPVCGGGNVSLAKNVVPLAVHAFHSSDDSVVPVEKSRSMVCAVIAAGGKRMRYTEYNYTDHGSWKVAAETPGLLEWLFSQTREK